MRQQNHASPKRGIAKTKLQASAAQDPETLQSQIQQRAKNRLPINGLEIIHRRRGNVGLLRKHLASVVSQILQSMRSDIKCRRIHSALVPGRGFGALSLQDVVDLVFDSLDRCLGVGFPYPTYPRRTRRPAGRRLRMARSLGTSRPPRAPLRGRRGSSDRRMSLCLRTLLLALCLLPCNEPRAHARAALELEIIRGVLS
jgi:hypothetical protein